MATVGAAIISLLLLRQTILLRKVETDPDIAIYLESIDDSWGTVNLVIKNIGRGSAHSIGFVVRPDDPIWTNWTAPI